MAHDPTELVVASNGDIYVAPVGSTLPDSPTASLNAAFLQLGYVTEDGVTFTQTPNVAEFGAWQSRSPVRRELVSQEFMVGFALEQWDATNVPFAFGGGEVTEESPGIYRFDFVAPDDALDERAMVIDWHDGDKDYRLVLPRGNVTEATETQLQRSELSVLPISFKALQPADGDATVYLLTNDPAFEPVGS